MNKKDLTAEDMLAIRIGRLVKENAELEQRVHQLVDDYNDVARQLRGMEKRKDKDPANKTLDELKQLREHCDKLEKNIEQLKRVCIQLQIERNEAKTRADECDMIAEDLFKHIARLEKSEFLKIGDDCPYRDSLPNGHRVNVCSEVCRTCPHMIKVDVSGKKCVLCAYCYDDKKAKEELECKNTDE